jgi:hypothetical protein
MSIRSCFLHAIAAAALAASPVEGQARPSTTSKAATQAAPITTFITTLGNDTVAVEQFTRSGPTITGDYVVRPGGTVVNHYVLHLDSSGLPSKLELTQHRADGTPVPNGPRWVTMEIAENEAVVIIERDTAITRRFAIHHAIPLLGTSFGLLEVGFERLRATRADSAAFPGLPLNAQQLPDPIQVKFFAPDSLRFWSASGPLYAKIDDSGRIVGVSGRETSTRIEARRVSTLDLPALIASFGAADAAGRGIRP